VKTCSLEDFTDVPEEHTAFHHQNQRVMQANNQQEAGGKQSDLLAWFTLQP
jgi:hypothetical protein